MLFKRFLTALVLAPLVILIIVLPSTPLFALLAALAFLIALWEWARLSGLNSRTGQTVWLLVSVLLFVGLWLLHGPIWTPLLLLAGVAWWLLACVWLRHFAFAAAPTRENRALKLLAGAFVVFPAWMAMLGLHARPDGNWWTLLAVIIVWAADIGAYFAGRTFGKRKLAPQISPGKTWAGAWGAVVAGVLATLIGAWLLDVRGGKLVLLALLGALTVAVSIVGDLLESLMKRHAKMKDSGTLFPGHGGIMDRLDSVFAALPVFAAGVLLLNA